MTLCKTLLQREKSGSATGACLKISAPSKRFQQHWVEIISSNLSYYRSQTIKTLNFVPSLVMNTCVLLRSASPSLKVDLQSFIIAHLFDAQFITCSKHFLS